MGGAVDVMSVGGNVLPRLGAFARHVDEYRSVFDGRGMAAAMGNHVEPSWPDGLFAAGTLYVSCHGFSSLAATAAAVIDFCGWILDRLGVGGLVIDGSCRTTVVASSASFDGGDWGGCASGRMVRRADVGGSAMLFDDQPGVEGDLKYGEQFLLAKSGIIVSTNLRTASIAVVHLASNDSSTSSDSSAQRDSLVRVSVIINSLVVGVLGRFVDERC